MTSNFESRAEITSPARLSSDNESHAGAASATSNAERSHKSERNKKNRVDFEQPALKNSMLYRARDVQNSQELGQSWKTSLRSFFWTVDGVTFPISV